MKLKKALAVLLMLCMAAGLLAGCGDKDDDSRKKKDKTPSIVKGSMEEMLEAIGKVKAGTLRVEQTIADTIGGTSVTDISFDREAGEYSVHVNVVTKIDGETKVESDADYFVIKDNKLYFNMGAMGSIASTLMRTAMTGESVEDIQRFIDEYLKGWFVFPLPNGWEKAIENFIDESLRTELQKTLVSSVTPQGEDGDYTVKFTTKDDYKALLTKTKEFSDKNAKTLVTGVLKNVETLGGIDINAYVSELIDFYQGDVKDIVKEYGSEFGIEESQLNEILKEVKKQDVAALWKQLLGNSDLDLTSESTASLLTGKITEMFTRTLEQFDTVEGEMPAISVRVAADDTAYTVAVKMDEAEGMNVDLSYRLVPCEVKVKAPDETVGLKSICALLAPSFLKYVYKSRAASDAMSLSEIMTAATIVAADPEFNLPAGSTFLIDFDNGNVALLIRGDGSNGADFEAAQKEWATMCNLDNYFTIQDKNLKQAEGAFVGTIQEKGNITWELRDANSAMKLFLDTAGGTLSRFEIKQ